MRRRFVIGLVLVNAFLASALLVTPVDTQMMPMGLFDCCQEEAGALEAGYCCYGCCWWDSDCSSHEDCQIERENFQQQNVPQKTTVLGG